MHLITILAVALPLVANAQQQQFPFVDTILSYVDIAKSKLEDALPSANRVGAATFGSADVTELTMGNWRDTLKHSGAAMPGSPPEAWMVYATGGNKTCKAQCRRADKAWDTAVSYLKKDVSAPHLALVDCDRQEILCGAWAVDIPSLYFFLVPHPTPDQSSAETPLTIHALNRTTATDADITKIHTRQTYLHTPKYEGVLHPFDGWVAKYYLMEPMAYFLFGMAKIPSWLFMIGLSFFSRSFMARRMPGAPGNVAANAPDRNR